MINKDVEIDSLLNSKPSREYTKYLRVRCPSCLKLYAIDSAEIREARPKFACVECEQKFWIPFPEALDSAEALMGFPQEWDARIEVPNEDQLKGPISPSEDTKPSPKLDIRAFSCPKCSEPYAAGQMECQSCGVLFKKFIERARLPLSSINTPREVRVAWDEAIENYEDFQKHQNFIRVCQTQDCLEYAFQQYHQILQVNPSDEIALRAQKELSALALTIAEVRTVPKAGRQLSMPRFPKLRLVNFLFLLCGIVIAMGFLMPEARNLVGFGSAALFMFLALRFYFRLL